MRKTTLSYPTEQQVGEVRFRICLAGLILLHFLIHESGILPIGDDYVAHESRNSRSGLAFRSVRPSSQLPTHNSVTAHGCATATFWAACARLALLEMHLGAGIYRWYFGPQSSRTSGSSVPWNALHSFHVRIPGCITLLRGLNWRS
jgi:hypothetical protein